MTDSCSMDYEGSQNVSSAPQSLFLTLLQVRVLRVY